MVNVGSYTVRPMDPMGYGTSLAFLTELCLFQRDISA